MTSRLGRLAPWTMMGGGEAAIEKRTQGKRSMLKTCLALALAISAIGCTGGTFVRPPDSGADTLDNTDIKEPPPRRN